MKRTLVRLDRTVFFGLTALVLLTPLAIGAVNRGAFVAMEMAIFTLAAVWMVKSILSGTICAADPLIMCHGKRLLFLLITVGLVLLLQLIPIPPRILHILSPGAYRVYHVAFPGWPLSNLQLSRNLPLGVPRWRPLTLSRVATAGSMLDFLALAAIFLVVLFYPFEKEQFSEMGFVLRIVGAVVTTGAIVALFAIAQCSWWNGKILWFYQPADWAGPLMVDLPRASGPFVNPDHFANYLALILPLAVAGALFPNSIVTAPVRPNVRLLLAGAALLMMIAVALSLSRGGWLAACTGITATLLIVFWRAPSLKPVFLQRLRLQALPLGLVACALLVVSTLYIIGRPGRSAVTTRIATTTPDDFSARIGAWRETLAMIKDFPLFGVGAGAWPEIFPHYQQPPESRYYFFRTAENDYLQFVAEYGLVALATLVIFTALIIRAVMAAEPRIPLEKWPIFAGLLGGLGGALVQESVDSSLHIPANALLFTILLAAMLRVALSEAANKDERSQSRPAHRSLPWLLAPAAAIAMIAAWKQNGGAYPYSVSHPTNLTLAGRNLVDHPAMAAAHVALAELIPNKAEDQRAELSAAVWLDPNEPLARDLLARNLLLAHRKPEGLKELMTSLHRAPFLDAHYYLAPAAIMLLLPEEQQAIAVGLSRAIDDRFGDAAEEQASFFRRLGRERDAAAAYEHGARTTSDNGRRLYYLLMAAETYARLRDYANGARVLLAASSLAPDDPRPYVELAQNIYGPQKKFEAAAAIIQRGIDNGADPHTLEMALASAAEMTGRYQIAETVLDRAVKYEPSFEAMLHLGRIYLAESRFARAVAILEQATELNPQSAQAFEWLGRACQANYDYYHAAQAFRHATLLAPDNENVRTEYREIQARIAAGGKTADLN